MRELKCYSPSHLIELIVLVNSYKLTIHLALCNIFFVELARGIEFITYIYMQNMHVHANVL